MKGYSDKINYKKDGLFLAVFLAAAAFLFWKCRYGVGNIDESFYLTVPYRLMKGDSLFLHEWHLSQMAGVLTLPFVSLYVTLNQGTEGIILAMRLLTTMIQCTIGVVVYLRLRRYHWLGAVCGTLSFMLYIPFGIMALSYNSMGIMLTVLAGVLMLSDGKHKKIVYVCSGISFAGAVLCCPYLVLVYGLYTLTVATRLVLQKKMWIREEEDSVWSLQRWILFTAGTVISAAAFAVFVLSRASLDKIIIAFTEIMNDPEHPPVSLWGKLKSYMYWMTRATTVAPQIYSLLGALLAVCVLDRERKDHKDIYFPLAAIATIMLMITHYRDIDYINAVMWPVNVLAIFVVLLTENKKTKNLFTCFWLPGILYSYCLHLTSNQTILAICSASSVATVGSIVMIGSFLEELIDSKDLAILYQRCIVILTGLILCIQIGTQADLRYRSVFWETGMEGQTQKMTEGIQKGLYVTEYKENLYYNTMKNIEKLKAYPGNKVLHLSDNTWYYLVEDYEMATYSAWLSGVNQHSLGRLKAYYDLSPEKMPDKVYADAASEEMVLLFADMFDYEIRDKEGCFILTK